MSKLSIEQNLPSREGEELSALTNPEADLKSGLDKISSVSKEDWSKHVDFITIVRRVILNHPDVVTAKQKLVILALIDEVDNLRSFVSRNAIMAFADMFYSLKKSVDNDLDLILPVLLRKYSESKLYEPDNDKALEDMIGNLTASKVLLSLLNSANHKNALIRQKVAMSMSSCIENVGDKILKFKEITKLLQTLSMLVQDGATETRNFAKTALFAIYSSVSNEAEFEKLLVKLSVPEGRAIKDTIQKMQKKQGPSNETTKSPPPTVSPSKIPSKPSTPTPKETTSQPTTQVTANKSAKESSTDKKTTASPAKETTSSSSTPEKPPSKRAQRVSGFAPPIPEEVVFRAPVKAQYVVGNDMEENITVAVRMRPLFEDEINTEREIWKVDIDTSSVFCTEERANRSLRFMFDYVVGPEQSSTDVLYETIGQDIIKSVMDGYNGLIFAYGQTASGKTYTMMGTEDNPGFIPIAISSIFENIKTNTQREFLLRVSYLEIYNEVINDLLQPDAVNLSIREDPKTGMFIEGLKEEIVVSPDHCLHVINSGEAQRHVASTDYNLMSSRSHTVFRMVIESNQIGDTDAKNVRVSALTLIDLAGSEKVVSDNAQRRREGAYINKSLLTLGTIISKLSERKKGEKIGHLPYRDSKLTRILEPTLGGNSRIAVICTITPGSGSWEETNSTLKFASRAKKITNKAKYGSDQDKALLMKYRLEIDELRRQLETAQNKEKEISELHDKSETSSTNSTNESEEQKTPEQLKLVDELKHQLQEQETIRVSLEEKIKQLTKLILVSTSVPQEPPQRNRAVTGGKSLLSKLRSKTHSMMDWKEKYNSMPLPNDGSEGKESSDTSSDSTTKAEKPTSSDLPDITKDSLIMAMKLKLATLEEQMTWRNKQLEKLKREVHDRNEKVDALMAIKISELKSEDMDALKAILADQYVKQIEELKDTVHEKDFEIEIAKADNQFLRERIAVLEHKAEI